MSITAGVPLQSTTRGDGRERILDEARTRFLTNGYAETSMQEIADAVGMTKPALYYHFKDKQDLLLAVMEREMTVALTVFQENLTADKSLGKRLERGAVWSFSSIQGDFGRLMADMHRVLPTECILDFKRAHPMPVDMVRQILDEAKANGEVGCDIDTEILARLYVGMIFGQLAIRHSEAAPDTDPERLGAIVARVFMEGICRPSGNCPH
jgi:AcrR family transcriptional regulator